MGRKSFIQNKKSFENEYRRYERWYKKVYEEYGNNMASKLNRKEYRQEVLDEYKATGRKLAPKTIARREILTTYSEGKAAVSNFYARLEKISKKNPSDRTKIEQSLLDTFTDENGKFRKVSVKAFRAQRVKFYDRDTKTWKQEEDLISKTYYDLKERKMVGDKEVGNFVDNIFKSL